MLDADALGSHPSGVPLRRFRCAPLGEGAIVFPTAPGPGAPHFYLLNRTALFAIRHGNRPIPELAVLLAGEFDIDRATAAADLRAFGLQLESMIEEFRTTTCRSADRKEKP
jgi:hypothetical protein